MYKTQYNFYISEEQNMKINISGNLYSTVNKTKLYRYRYILE